MQARDSVLRELSYTDRHILMGNAPIHPAEETIDLLGSHYFIWILMTPNTRVLNLIEHA